MLGKALPGPGRVPINLPVTSGSVAFGDLGDPDSEVSRNVAERGGFDLLPEFGYKPVNKYLPPRQRKDAPPEAGPVSLAEMAKEPQPGSKADRFFAWADRVLSR